MQKIKAENGKWKKLVRNSQKKLVAATLAGAIMGTAFAPMTAHAWTARTPEQIKADIGTVQSVNELSRYNLRYGDTLWGISQATGFTVLDIVNQFSIPDASFIRSGRTLEDDHVRVGGSTQQQTPDTHSVVSGDTLSKIALRYGVTVEQLANWNNIQNVDLIHVGQTFAVREGVTVPGSNTQTSGSNSDAVATTPATSTPEAPSQEDSADDGDTGNFGAVGNTDTNTGNTGGNVDTGNNDTDEKEEDVVEETPEEPVTPEAPVTPEEPVEDEIVDPGVDPSIPVEDKTDDTLAVVDVREEVKQVVIEYHTITEYDDTMPKGTKKVTREGHDGLLEYTYNVYTYEDGSIGWELKAPGTMIAPATDEVIMIGTGLAVEEDYNYDKEIVNRWTYLQKAGDEIDFETIIIETTDLPKGVTKMMVIGEIGYEAEEYEAREFSDGTREDVFLGHTFKEPINEVWHVGI